jgi:hypothetical protein
VGLVIYAQALHFPPFIFDDALHIFENIEMRSGYLDSILYFITNSLTPLPYIVWRTVVLFTGLESPIPFHFLNMLLHILNAYIVYLLLNVRLEMTAISALIGATFFLVHPTQVESVVWISSLRGLMSTSFALLFFYQALNFKDDSLKHFIAVIAIYLLGLMSKPTMAPILIAPFLFSNEKTKNQLPLLVTLVVLGGIATIFHLDSLKNASLLQTMIGSRIILSASSLGTFFSNILFPFDLKFDYQINLTALAHLTNATNISLVLLILISLITVSYLLYRHPKTKEIGRGLCLFLILILPSLSFLPFDFQNISTVADRYLNLALLGPAYLLAHFFQSLSASVFSNAIKRFQTIPMALAVLAILSFYQVTKWGKPIELLLTGSEPPSTAMLLAASTQASVQGNFHLAGDLALKVLDRDPLSAPAILILIKLYEAAPDSSKIDSLIQFLEEGQYDPPLFAALPLAHFLMLHKRYDMALTYAGKAVSLNYEIESARLIMSEIINARSEQTIRSLMVAASFFMIKNDNSEAARLIDLALGIAPQHSELLNLKKRLNLEAKP